MSTSSFSVAVACELYNGALYWMMSHYMLIWTGYFEYQFYSRDRFVIQL